MAKRTGVYISVDRRSIDGAIQVSINLQGADGCGHGQRIAGPKYDGRGANLLEHFLTETDCDELLSYIRMARADLAKKAAA